MKYGSLVTFHPIESVIQLRDAGKEAAAREHVSTYVISEEMAQRLSQVVIPHLQYLTPQDSKGILIVGNYGTGKSHLLSVISSVAENAAMAPLLTHPDVRHAAASIAGRFKVIRLEIGSTEMGLREILTKAMQTHLEQWGVSFRFPAATEQYENKSLFEKMMAEFHAKFPDHGLLLVVDELLDYLRSRKNQPLILDLGFLREVGEVCKDLRFRFVAGVQEAIFESGSFSFVADSLRRVKDRFVQARIASADVQYVVANRLLSKTPTQAAQVREYLQPFTRFYGNMNERLSEFAALFPIHPDYIGMFETVPIIEKRGVLQVISDTIKGLLDQDVPAGRPGVVAYDSYWRVIIERPDNLAVPEVKEIADCADVVSGKIRHAFVRPQYRPMALRIVDALAVHRLTTHDIHAPVGLTPEELRDGLCLYNETVGALPGDAAANLLTLIEKTLADIRKTVDGSFVSCNADNRQHYLDLKKTEDYDAIVERHTDKLTNDTLDRYYYDALRQVMECSDVPTHVAGYQIWQHELVWPERNAPRLGYLFFGAPNERSTAIPRRDFYLYFVQPFDTPRFEDGKLADETFFRLVEKDDAFLRSLKLYAAALELAGMASGGKKDTYRGKAMGHLGGITRWLREHLLGAFEVTYQGQKKKLGRWLEGSSSATINVRDTVNAVAARCLGGHFADIAPNYPRFTVLLTTRSIPQAAQDAIRGIAQPGTRTKQATAVLDALGLLDGDRLEPSRSPYAAPVVEFLKAKGEGQVLNRQELIQSVDGVDYFLPAAARLEPEWAVVLLAALVYSGDAVLAIPGAKFDATSLNTLATTDIADLVKFKHLEPPRGWPVAAMKALFELMGLPTGLAVEVTQGATIPVQQLNTAVLGCVQKLVMARQQLLNGIPFWGQNLFSEAESRQLSGVIDKAKEFLESLQAYNSPGKFKNLRYTREEILAHKGVLTTLKEIEDLQAFATDIGQFTQYLSLAEALLPPDHDWVKRSRAERQAVLLEVKDPARRASPKVKAEVTSRLRALQSEYVQAYLAVHRRARLTHDQNKAKGDLVQDYRLAQLQKLTAIPLLPRQQLLDFQERLGRLKPCFVLTEKDMERDPKCPHCGFWPGMEASPVAAETVLQGLVADLGRLAGNWTQALLDDLADPVVKSRFDLLKAAPKTRLQHFLKARELPDEIDAELVQALQDVLSELTKVPVKADRLSAVLFPDGSPATPTELRERLDRFLGDLLKGKDAAKVRIVME